MGRPIRILGIDPGLRRTGWGVIEVEGNRLIYIACGSAQSEETAALALELWRARGCPEGSPDEDWFRAVEELRSRACGH